MIVGCNWYQPFFALIAKVPLLCRSLCENCKPVAIKLFFYSPFFNSVHFKRSFKVKGHATRESKSYMLCILSLLSYNYLHSISPSRIIEELLLLYFSRRLCKTHTNSARFNGRDASAAVLNSGCA